MDCRLLQRLLIAAGVCLFLISCAPVQPIAPASVLRDWFTAGELEQALLAADIAPDEAGDALCSVHPEHPERLSTCVQFGPDDPKWWWVATWDMQAQRIDIEWRSNVEVQLQ